MLSTGVHQLSRAEYDAITDRANWSNVKVLGKSPAHYRHNLLVKREPTDALNIGIATHLAAYEPERFRAEVMRWDGDRRGAEWKAFEAANRDKTILKADAYDLALTLATAARNDRHAGKWLAGGKAEQTVLWTYRDAGGKELGIKSRLDFISLAGAVCDLKTCRDASLDGFGRQAFDLGYFAQAAIYSDGFFEATGKRLPYVLIAVEKTPPHVVQVYFVGEAELELGRTHYTRLLDQLIVCKETSNWPGYADGPVDLQLPRWAWPYEDEESVDGLGVTFGEGA